MAKVGLCRDEVPRSSSFRRSSRSNLDSNRTCKSSSPLLTVLPGPSVALPPGQVVWLLWPVPAGANS